MTGRCPHCNKPIRPCYFIEDKECFEPVYLRVKCQMVHDGEDVNPEHRCYLHTMILVSREKTTQDKHKKRLD